MVGLDGCGVKAGLMNPGCRTEAPDCRTEAWVEGT